MAKRSTPEPLAKEEFDQVVQTVEEIQDELPAIHELLEKIHHVSEWVANNSRNDDWQPIVPLTSMPADPLARDWAARLNRITPSRIPAPQPVATEPARETNEQPSLCCQ